jgi:O-antigen ligase
MELSYRNEPLPKIDGRRFLLVFLVTLAATFAFWGFPLYSIGLTAAILFLAGAYSVPELGVGILVNGLNLIGFLTQNVETSLLIIPAIIALYAPALIHYVLNHKLRWRFGIIPGLVVFIGAMMLIGTLYSPLPSQGLAKAGKYLATNLFIFFAAMLFIGDLDRVKNMLRIVAFLGFFTAAISVVYLAYTGIGDIGRFALPSQNPIWFARELGIALLATLCLVAISKKRLVRLIYASFMLVMLFLIYIAGSRGPFLALLVSLLFYFLLLQRGSFGFFKKSLFVLLTLFVLRLSVVIGPEHIYTRLLHLFSRFDLTTFYRLRAFETAKNLFLDNPFKGVGTAGFARFDPLGYPHNIVLELASELGIWGVAGFAGLVLLAGYLGIKLLRSKKASFLELNLSRTFLAIFVFALINAQISGAIYANHQLWFAIAGIWTLHCSQGRSLRAK